MLVIEAIKIISREQLEQLYVLSLHRQHEVIYRANNLEDKIEDVIKYIDKEINSMPNNGCSMRLKKIKKNLIK